MGRRKKKRPIIVKYLFVMLICISLLTVGLIYFIDILPKNYFGVLAGLFGFIDLVLSIMILSRNKKICALGSFIGLIFSILLIFAIIYELNTIDFLKRIGKNNYLTLNYSVVVLKDSKYNNISDIKNLNVGITDSIKEESKTKLNKKVKINYKDYKDYTILADNLINKKISVIILEDSELAILKEEYVNFDSLSKVIYEYSIDVKEKSTLDKVKITEEPFNIFISGIDTYGKINSVSRSDVNMIVTINPKKHKMIITSIPRDYYVKLNGKNEYDKLTHAGVYGIDTSINTIEDFLDIDINYYFKVNFTSLVKIVNTLDGIEVNSKYKFTSQDNYKYNEGINKLNGEEALSFARERKSLPNGDKSRGENHQAVLTGIINKAISKNIITKYNGLLKTLDGSFVTNLTNKEITNFIKMQIDKDIKWDIEYINLDGTDSYEYTYSYKKNKLYVMIPDKNSVKEASNTINKYSKK